jgi:hypothetical protein
MHFAPEAGKEVGVKARQLEAAMDPHVTPPAEGDVDRRAVHAGAAMVHHEHSLDDPRVGETSLATAVAGEDGLAVAGKVLGRAAAPIITGAAEAAGDVALH